MDIDKVMTVVETKGEGWWARAFNSTNLSADVKPLMFVLVVLTGVFLCIAQWCSKRLTQDLIDLFKVLAVLVGGGGAVWAGVERWRQPAAQDGGSGTTTTTTMPVPPKPPKPPKSPAPVVPPTPPTHPAPPHLPPTDAGSTTSISAQVTIKTSDGDADPGPTPAGKVD